MKKYLVKVMSFVMILALAVSGMKMTKSEAATSSYAEDTTSGKLDQHLLSIAAKVYVKTLGGAAINSGKVTISYEDNTVIGWKGSQTAKVQNGVASFVLDPRVDKITNIFVKGVNNFASFSYEWNKRTGTGDAHPDDVSLTVYLGCSGNHKWDDGTVTKDATCTEDGEKTVTCTKCGATDTVAIEKLGHRNIVTDPEIPATCTMAGITAGSHCEDCGSVIVAGREIKKLNHEAGEAVKENEIEATEENEGYYELNKYCTKCGELVNQEVVTSPAITKSDDEPTGDEPGNEPTGDEPSDDEPTGDEPSGDEPTGDEPSDDEPTGDEPSDDEPTGDEPSGDEPTGDEPSGDEPTGDEPSGDEPTGDEPSDDEPTGDEPSEEPVNVPDDDEKTDTTPEAIIPIIIIPKTEPEVSEEIVTEEEPETPEGTPVEEETTEETTEEAEEEIVEAAEPETPEGTPEEEEIIEVETIETPEGTPTEETEDEEVIEDLTELATPQGDALPQTGVVSAALFIGFGAVCISAGGVLVAKARRKENEE